MLVSLILEDLELFLQDKADSGLQIYDIALILLLFADDMTVFGKSPEDLQHSLDLMFDYCQKWGIEVNTSKTKIVVFRKKGRIRPNECWTFNNEVIDNFNYLGIVFNYNGNFATNNEFLIGKALKAMNTLLYNCKKVPVKPKVLCQLFDSFVGSILNYACEIWGCTKSKELERIHLKFCKRILKVRLNTSTAGVYGELARYPLYVARYCRIIKYWCKIINTDNIIISKLYTLALEDCNLGRLNWVKQVKQLLDNYGFSYIFTNGNVCNKTFPSVFKQRVIDCYLQDWNELLHKNSVLDEYKHFKSDFYYECYLDLVPHNLRSFITKMRLSSHSLRIHTGRYGQNRIPRNERFCLLCDLHEIEDIYHFAFKCPKYASLRQQYIDSYYFSRPSMYKLVQLFNSHDKTTLCNVARFFKLANNLRNGVNFIV